MARYIDADKLSIYFNALAEHAEMEGLQNMAHVHRRCLQIIEEEPTADVVPKSEVDLYRKQVDELEDELASTYDKFENAKAEVAREIFEEIFEEIYRSVASKIPMKLQLIFKDDRDFDAGVVDGKRDAFIEVLMLLAELKKKYT